MTRPALFLLLLAMSGLGAQSRARGIVRDSSGTPVAGAVVAVSVLGRVAQTDAEGRFDLPNLTPGMRVLSVRRIGYSAFSRMMEIGPGENEIPPVILFRLPTRLDTVVTEDRALWREAPLLREFEDNRKLGLGKFLTRADLEKARGRSMMSFFEELPGFSTVTLDGGRWIKSTRGVRSLNSTCYELEDQFGPVPASINCGCFPLVFLDFQLLSVAGRVPNINRYRPDDLEAIEIYRSAAQTPSRYAVLNSHCGVIVLHSRRPVVRQRQ